MSDHQNKLKIQQRQERGLYNNVSDLFKKLTRLFSGPLIQYRHQTERSLTKKNMDKNASKFYSTSGQHFKKTQFNPFENLNMAKMVNHQRALRYSEFAQMEFNPDLAAALDLYGEEMTTYSALDPILKIKCSNEEIREILQMLYYSILNIEFNLFGWCRNLCKYGDFFMYLDLDEDKGVKSFIGLPTEEMERIEGEDKNNPNYVQFQWNTRNVTFENWQVAHFRILGNDKFQPYGSSVLDPARRIFRQLNLLEDAMLAYRIVRSPERRVFYIDVGNVPPNEVETHMQKIITTMKSSAIIDADSGKADLRYSPLSIENDYFIPVRAGSNTKIESLPGGSYTGDIDDVKYLRDKLYSAIKVPMSYLSRGSEGSEDKASLSQRDIRFARTIQRLQKSVISELEKIGIIHLYILGYRGEDLLSFKLALNNPSKITELQELEHWRTKFDVASAATEGFFSRRWIAEKLFNLSDEEYLRNQRELFYDKEMDAKWESIGVAAEGGGELGGGGADSTGGEEIPSPEEEDILLAKPEGETSSVETPMQEEKEGYLTPKAKGKIYHPVVMDKRDMGARKRHMQSMYSHEMSSRANRNLFKGTSDMMSLSKGIAENKQTIYVEEEKQLLKDNNDIKLLIELLDKRNKKDENNS
jgi:hypothetical protein